jgi:hypothetical protein
MRNGYTRAATGLALAAIVSWSAGLAAADDISHSKQADGLTVYYGLVPAKSLHGFAEGSDEAAAHRHIPRGKHADHLVVAVFEGNSVVRVTDAQVTARVRNLGFGWTEKTLVPTTVGGALTFCNYFVIYDHDNYMIDIDIQRPGVAGIATAEFKHRG